MAIPPLAEEANVWATVTLGLNYGGYISAPDPGVEGGYSDWNYDWEADVPFLLVDHADPVPRVMIIHRRDEEVRFAPLGRFKLEQAVDLAKQLREQYTTPGRGMRFGFSGPYLVEQLKGHLDLSF